MLLTVLVRLVNPMTSHLRRWYVLVTLAILSLAAVSSLVGL